MLALISALFVTFVGGIVSIVVFWTMQRLRNPAETEENRDFAASFAFRIGAMHALVLALSFSVVMSDYEETEEVLDEEVVAVGKLLSLYHRAGKDAYVAQVKKYIAAVLSEGLSAQRIRSFSDSNRILSDLLTNSLLDTADSRPETTRALDLIETVRAHRIQRVFDLRQGLPAAFWLFGILGYLLILYAMTVYAPNAFRLELVFAYGALVALLLYIIYEMGYPFAGVYRLEPTGFQDLLRFYDLGATQKPAF